jgi:hypothetical protein
MPTDAQNARKNEEIYTSSQINQLRRDERGVHDEGWIKAFLRGGAYGTLATAAGEQPFLNAHNYVYDEAEHCIYFHRSPVGRTSANLEHNPRVCYQVVEMGRMYIKEAPLNFSVEYRSVVIFGTAHRTGPEESARALHLLVEKYAPHLQPGVDYQDADLECPAAAVYRVDIETWSGKKNEVPADYPGAYEFK